MHKCIENVFESTSAAKPLRSYDESLLSVMANALSLSDSMLPSYPDF